MFKLTGENHDFDHIRCDKDYQVFEKFENNGRESIILIVREKSTPVGYVKLRFVICDMIYKDKNNLNMSDESNFIRECCIIDEGGRLMINKIDHKIDDPNLKRILHTKENKPACKMKNYYDTSSDINKGYLCEQWPTFAQEWISRDRLFGWPTDNTVHQLSLRGFFLVKKGHPLSQEKDLEWKVSFSLQERDLMFSLTDVQHKCYTVLKMFNKEIIKSDCITAYHWKTCLFYVIEQNSGIIWKRGKLFVCIQICILQMLAWVKSELCPNYFIPQDNLFAGTLNKSQKMYIRRKN